jgi:ribosome biogenesis protein ERB1
LPQKFSSLRAVPAYTRFAQERFERMLDLFLCPRERRARLNIDPDSLLPRLPQPSELRPFPERLAIVFKGHTAAVTALSVSPTGHWLATGACVFRRA